MNLDDIKKLILIEQNTNNTTTVDLKRLDLTDLIGEKQGYLKILSSNGSISPVPLICAEDLPKNIINKHYKISDFGDAFIVALNNVSIYSRYYCASNNKIIHIPEVYPEYFIHRINTLKPLVGINTNYKKLKKLILSDRPVCILPHFNSGIYGHFLLEVMPKLLSLKFLCAMGIDFDLLISEGMPKFQENIILLGMLPYKVNVLRFYPEREYINASRVLFPSMISNRNYAFNQNFHSVLTDLIAKSYNPLINKDITSDCHRFIAISRLSRRDSRKDHRLLENEKDVLERLQNLGAYIVEPEQLSFLEQVRIFNQANLIVGEFSSALHNTLFSPVNSGVIAINWLSGIQSRIANFCGHNLTYVLPNDNTPVLNPKDGTTKSFSVNIDKLEKKVLHFLNQM